MSPERVQRLRETPCIEPRPLSALRESFFMQRALAAGSVSDVDRRTCDNKKGRGEIAPTFLIRFYQVASTSVVKSTKAFIDPENFSFSEKLDRLPMRGI
ncbi:hypothetical protein [Rhizobium sp. Leaf341]|uniref:hypothetical protein n=1 Tax=Rhizobium sp. Leaf341 TaxID=1736344 RepID=UPI0012E390AE|nr:hypothetical protein [Rhizobium sp. Leaf341]